MGINLGLSAGQYQDLLNLCVTPHRVDTRIALLNLDQAFLGDITPHFLSGTVSWDVGGDISRSASLQLLDYERSLNIAPASPTSGVAYPTRMMQIQYGIGSSDGQRWYYVPVFTGPVTGVERNGITVNIELMGKESLSNGDLWNGKTYKEGWNKVALIRDILMRFSGEQYFSLGPNPARTGSKLAVNRNKQDSPWAVCKNLAASIGWNLFYDGRGYLTCRPYNSALSHVFSADWVLDDPDTSYDLSNLVNAAEVTGATPKGKGKKPFTGRYEAPANDPLSPQSLGRGGVKRYYPRIEQNGDLRSNKDCYDAAVRYVQEGLRQATSSSFPCVPMPLLEENDLIQVSIQDYNDVSRFTTGTLPLSISDPSMTIGYTKSMRTVKL